MLNTFKKLKSIFSPETHISEKWVSEEPGIITLFCISLAR
jgi:hypothetical protein